MPMPQLREGPPIPDSLVQAFKSADRFWKTDGFRYAGIPMDTQAAEQALVPLVVSRYAPCSGSGRDGRYVVGFTKSVLEDAASQTRDPGLAEIAGFILERTKNLQYSLTGLE